MTPDASGRADWMSSHEKINSHKVNSHEINFPRDQLNKVFIYKNKYGVYYVKLNAHDKVGMFAATLHCHTVHRSLNVSYICEIVVDSSQALFLIFAYCCYYWLATTSSGWLCSLLQDYTVVSWVVTLLDISFCVSRSSQMCDSCHH